MYKSGDRDVDYALMQIDLLTGYDPETLRMNSDQWVDLIHRLYEHFNTLPVDHPVKKYKILYQTGIEHEGWTVEQVTERYNRNALRLRPDLLQLRQS